LDENADGILVDGNRCWNNGGAGIMCEISFDGEVRNNVCWRNCQREKGTFWDCEILLSSVDRFNVHHNTVDGRCIIGVFQDRPPWSPPATISIHDNVMTLRDPDARVGAWTDIVESIPAVAVNVVFANNKYHVPTLTYQFWDFHDTDYTLPAAQAAGYDLGSTADTTFPPEPV
jgi:hypothetical protein